MNELDLSNTQAVYSGVAWLTGLSKPPRPQKKRPNRARKCTDNRNT